MTWFDGILGVLIILPVILGINRGVRATLILLIMILTAFLASLLLTLPLERLLLRFTESEMGTPLPMALILEERKGAALWASLIPGLLFCFTFTIFFLLFRSFKRKISKIKLTRDSRWGGFFTGFLAGAIVSYILVIQLGRLPWPPGLYAIKNSSILSFFGELNSRLVFPMFRDG